MIFNGSVSHDEEGNTRLLCRLELRNERVPESCTFIRPDGKVLYMTPAVSDERYVLIIVNYGETTWIDENRNVSP